MANTNQSLIVQQVSALATKFNIPESSELVSVLKNTAFKGQVNDAQFSALLIVANQYGLNPWTREIYAFPDKNNGIVPVVGVDGWSRIINENAQFDGLEFKQDDDSCTCIIYRKDRTHAIQVTEYMSECKRGSPPWQSHPKRMLRHKSLIQCARLAFGYTGIFDQDEAERILEATEKDITPDDDTPKARPVVADADFNASKAKFKASVDTGKHTVQSLIAWIESKGADLTEAQKNEVASWEVKQTVIEGDFTEVPTNDNDDFTAAYEAANQEKVEA